ncbi:MAG: indole-3-glycerol phosphate synthase TrpC [Firmicutes bacterium]|nr:indole-3-glycerol phosphate synthase TrpC [Bacillota bacterium]
MTEEKRISILEEILAKKKERKLNTPPRTISDYEKILDKIPAPANFTEAVKKASHMALIAEIKKASPSRGIIVKDFKPEEIARIYQREGASAISVLTEEDYFGGSLEVLRIVRSASTLPVLRKDFLIDETDIYETRACGADSPLLIVRILFGNLLERLLNLSRSLEMEPLVEVHNRQELERALDAGAGIIGINNRDIATFKVDINLTLELKKYIPDDILVVSESGISSSADVAVLKKAGIHGILVGESILASNTPSLKIRELIGSSFSERGI